MFAIRLVQLIETHAESLSEGLLHRLKSSERSRELLLKLPPDEARKRAYEIYHNLSDWLVNKTESEIEERYIGLGVRRARQGIPFSSFLWTISATKEYLWEFLQRECMEEPIELLGEMELTHSLELFFDRVLYFAAIGYESVHRGDGERTFESAAVGQK